MKRKIIQLGNSTLVTSLPSKWAKRLNLKAGDEIDVEEEDNILKVGTKKKEEYHETDIDLSGKTAITHRFLSAVYKAGFDKIKIGFRSPEELNLIQRTVNEEFIGFEIVDQGKDYIIAKRISKIEHSEFPVMLRRTFLFLLSIADDSITAAKESKYDELRGLILRDSNINKLTDFCRRLLNKHGYEKLKKTPTMYFIVEQLEKIGDEYRDISKIISDKKLKLDASSFSLFEKVNAYLRKFYGLFYNYNLDKLTDFIEDKKRIEGDFNRIFETSKKEKLVLVHLYKILYLVFDMNGPLMVTKF